MALSGFCFNVGVFEVAPRMYLSVNADGVLEATGLIADILYIMAEFLGFSINLVKAEANKYGKSTGNGSWEGLLGKVFNKEIDFDGVGLIPDSERIDYFDFTAMPLFSSYMAVIVRQRAEKELDLTTYLKPFSLNIWIVIFIMSCLTWLSNLCDTNTLCKFSAIASTAKVLLPISICFTILMACYTSLLIAAVTVGEKLQFYDTLDDLVQERFYFGVHKSGIYYKIVKNIKSYPYQGVMGRMDAGAFNEADAIKRCTHEKFAFITNSVSALKEIERHCSLDILATKYFPSGNYFTFSKNSNLTEIFSVFLNRLASSGILRKLTEHYIRKSRPHCDTSKYCSAAIKFSQVLTPFLLLGTGIVFSLTLCLIELKIDKYYLSKINVAKVKTISSVYNAADK